MFRVHFGRFVLLALCFLVISGGVVHAQTTCGSIIEIYGTDRYESPIEDCSNPFGIIAENPNLEVSFEGARIQRGSSYKFVNAVGNFTAVGTHPEAFTVGFGLYKQIAEGFLRINEDDNGTYTFSEAGTYTIVVYEEPELILTQNWFMRLLGRFTPVAHAFPGASLALNFEVVEPVLGPTGISNILFLPGIQASRLYTKVDGNEERLWEPGGNADVEKLRMTETGESITDIYTRDVVDEKGGVAVGDDVYKGFLQHLIALDGPSGGPLITTFPYDWRYDVFDIVENGTKTEDGSMVRPTDAIATSASLSPTGKVTLIAHSNGGLLAKAIMLKLEEEGKAHLVDKVIFIASPHTGTPKGIAALLHGFDQELISGILADDEVVRGVMKNMPGVYGLLPSEEYFSTLSEPMISFDGSSTTALYRNAYGFAVSNMDEYISFLRGGEGRADAGDRVNEISTANNEMLESALTHHRAQLDSWSAPEGVVVYNIVGTGLSTPKSIEYREFKESFCDGCPVTQKLEPVLHFTRYGDETVVSKSASFLNDTKHYINLFEISEFVHANITESETVQTLVDHILHGSSTEGINFVTDTEPVFADDIDIHTIHSPARIYVRDSDGNITGRTEEGGEWQTGIPESDYFEVGGVKYVLVPSTGAYTVTVEGEGAGVYSHMLTTLKNEAETVRHAFTASITPTSVIEYTKTDDIISTISVDENGDGNVDKNMTLTGEIIEEEVTYDDLETAIRALNLTRRYERPLLELVRNAERLSHHRFGKRWKRHGERVLLHVVGETLERYKKKGLITIGQYNEVENIIDGLIEKKI